MAVEAAQKHLCNEIPKLQDCEAKELKSKLGNSTNIQEINRVHEKY